MMFSKAISRCNGGGGGDSHLLRASATRYIPSVHPQNALESTTPTETYPISISKHAIRLGSWVKKPVFLQTSDPRPRARYSPLFIGTSSSSLAKGNGASFPTQTRDS